jgi:hypothetical protein
MGQGATYSFKSLVGVFTNPPLGVTIPLTGGNLGAGGFTVRMTTDRTVHEVAADGTVLISYIAGDNGELDIEAQETSVLHSALLAAYNLALAAANADDVSAWATIAISFRMLTDGSQHLFSGVSFQKFPDKPYQARGQNVTWKLMIANAYNM